ncbi:MAG: P-loop NTPase [Rickettsiales bacterium]
MKEDPSHKEIAVRAALDGMFSPDGKLSFSDAELLSGVSAKGERCGVVLTDKAAPFADYLQEKLDREVPHLGARVIVNAAPKNKPTGAKPHVEKTRVPGVGRVIFVGAGKGGVGKSAVTAALGLRMAQEGKRVALLDADIYGPSFPSMFDVRHKPKLRVETEKMIPADYKGMQIMSVGFIVERDKALSWRGPMASKTVMQLVAGTEWSADVLIIDLPPGTGDVALSLCSHVISDGAVVVTQPHALSVDDAARAGGMFAQLGIPILGVVENMARVETGSETLYPFGQGGGEEAARKLGAPLLTSVPLYATDEGGKPFLRMAREFPEATIDKICHSFH